jgi:hypothetical protein
MIRKLIFLLIVFVSFTQCDDGKPEHTSTNKQAIEDDSEHFHRSKTGLKIEYKPTRGQSYTDESGTKYQLRHIPVMITNDSTISINIQLAFSKEYDYPIAYKDEQFKVFSMSKDWALDGVEITDSTLRELPKYIDHPEMHKTIQPGETFMFAIGTLYPNSVNYGAFPVALFSHDNRTLHHECNQLIDSEKLNISPLVLELLIGFTGGSQASPDSCITISCGQISYSN